MRLVFVNRRNHSLTAGRFLAHVGEMRAQYIRDLRTVIPLGRCDGMVWTRTCDGKVISEVASIEAAAIWEIGRLMLESRPSRGRKKVAGPSPINR